MSWQWIARKVQPGGYLDGVFSAFSGYRTATGAKWFQYEDQSSGWGGTFWTRVPRHGAWQVEAKR
jgi:hypothetical protein